MPGVPDGRWSIDPAALMPELITLDLLQFADRAIVAVCVMEQSELKTWRDPMLGNLVATLSTHVLADKTADETITVDRFYAEWSSWWQHTKAVHFPTLSRWMRRPPRTVRRRVTVEFHPRQWMTFPNADTYPVRLGAPVIYERVDWADTP